MDTEDGMNRIDDLRRRLFSARSPGEERAIRRELREEEYAEARAARQRPAPEPWSPPRIEQREQWVKKLEQERKERAEEAAKLGEERRVQGIEIRERLQKLRREREARARELRHELDQAILAGNLDEALQKQTNLLALNALGPAIDETQRRLTANAVTLRGLFGAARI
jgi:hypothetical protein